jgi:hypothetical protein
MHGTVAPKSVHVQYIQYFQSRCRKPSVVLLVPLFKKIKVGRGNMVRVRSHQGRCNPRFHG